MSGRELKGTTGRITPARYEIARLRYRQPKNEAVGRSVAIRRVWRTPPGGWCHANRLLDGELGATCGTRVRRCDEDLGLDDLGRKRQV